MPRRSSIFDPPPMNAPWGDQRSYLGRMLSFLLARRIAQSLVQAFLVCLTVLFTAGILFACSYIAYLRGA